MCCSALSIQTFLLAEDKVYLRPVDPEVCTFCPNTLGNRIITCADGHGFHRECILARLQTPAPTCNGCHKAIDQTNVKVLHSVGEFNEPVIIQLHQVELEVEGDDGVQYHSFVRVGNQYTTFGKILRSAANCFHWAAYGMLNGISKVLVIIGSIPFSEVLFLGFNFSLFVGGPLGIGIGMFVHAIPSTLALDAWLFGLEFMCIVCTVTTLAYTIITISKYVAPILAINKPAQTPCETWNDLPGL